MAAKRCPNCQLVNPGSARSCDCGYSFADGSMGQALDLSKPGAPDTSSAATANSMANGFLRILIFIGVGIAIAIVKILIRG